MTTPNNDVSNQKHEYLAFTLGAEQYALDILQAQKFAVMTR